MNRWTAMGALILPLAVALAGCAGGEATSPQMPTGIATTALTAAVPTASPEAAATSAPARETAARLALSIEPFEDGGPIPARYTCIGENASPAASWSGVPPEARSLVLIVYDADAGAELGAGNDLGFLHWMVYDILPTAAGLPLAATGNAQLLEGGIETANDFFAAAGATFPGGGVIRGTGYDGPCPPAQHTYVFRLLALSQALGLPAGTPYQTVLAELEGHVLATADWTGIYPPS